MNWIELVTALLRRIMSSDAATAPEDQADDPTTAGIVKFFDVKRGFGTALPPTFQAADVA